MINANPHHYDHRFLSSQIIIEWFERANAYWYYKGLSTPEKPHAELTSGFCTNSVFNCDRILCYPNIAQILGWQLGVRLRKPSLGKVDYVISSSYSAIILGHEVAKYLKARFRFVEKDPSDPNGKRMLWQRMTIPPEARVLQVEDVITTFSTVNEVRGAVQKGNKEPVFFIPIIGTLVHRPPKLPVSYKGVEVISVIEREIPIFDSKDCPYCAVGSKRYRPKTNWEELTGEK